MSDPFDGSGDIPDEIAPGRGDIDGTWAPDWIVLSCSARAVQLYMMLRLRLNRRRRDRKVWPGLATLAVMMKVGTSETVSPYVKELQKIGAIDIEHARMPRRNIYRINVAPPDSYDGPMALEDWDGNPLNRLKVKKILDAEKAKREKTRAKPAKPQVGPDPGKNPDQARPGKTPPADPGKIRDQEPGKNPDLDPGFLGVEPLGVKEVLKRDLSATPASFEKTAMATANLEQESNAEISSQDQHQEIPETAEYVKSDAHWPTLTDAEQALVDELAAMQPRWLPRTLRKVLGSKTIRDVAQRDPELVRRAFLLGARHERTVPMRMWFVEECPHWKHAARRLQAERDPQDADAGTDTAQHADTTAAVPAPRLPVPPQHQEMPRDTGGPSLSRAEAIRLASERIAASREKARAAEEPPRLHAERMAEMDRVLAEVSGA